jgi:tagatose 1,6-diphosphate aldolase
MVNTKTGDVMGDIDLRVGLTEKLKMMGGHIGYEVYEPYRGHRYATRSCRLLLPFARKLGIETVLITCDPQNIPSVKTIEALGAELIKTHEVELEPGVFRWTNVYHLHTDRG